MNDSQDAARTYRGTVRYDAGPMAIERQTVRPCTRDGVPGVLCSAHLENTWRLPVEAYDTGMVIEVLRCARDGTPLRRLLDMGGCEDGKGQIRPLYTIVDESPDNGMLGLPLRAWMASSGIHTAIAMHGRVVSSCERPYGSRRVAVFQMSAAGLRANMYCAKDGLNDEMSAILRAGHSARGRWLEAGGFGHIQNVRNQGTGRIEHVVTIIDAKVFRFAEGAPWAYRAMDRDKCLALSESLRPTL
jgi:hypothetical protein